ncbi:MAG: hypothetical protein ACLGHJ_10895 [Gammaproteobacteria bacterium]
MSTSNTVSSRTFVLLTRLFSGLKRAGRVIDVVWFQQDAGYARAVLARAAEDDDDTVRQIGSELQALLADFLAPPPSAVPEPAPAPATVTPEPESQLPPDKYVGRLR